MSDSNLPGADTLLSLPRFGVSKLFGAMTLVCVLAAAAWWLSPMVYGVVLIVSGFLVVHVLGAVVGNRLRGNRLRRDRIKLEDAEVLHSPNALDGDLRVRS